jgi:hypothetical protein
VSGQLTVSCSHELVVRWCPASNEVRIKTEESPLLGTVTKKRLVKITREGDNMCYSDLLSVQITGSAIIICSYEFISLQ